MLPRTGTSGAVEWAYVALLDGPVEEVLQRLRTSVFRSGNWVDDTPSPASAQAADDEPVLGDDLPGGPPTCSILDTVAGVSTRPAPCSVSPLTERQLREMFGTTLPSARAVEQWLAGVEITTLREPDQGFYVVADAGWDLRVYVAGSSRDV